MREEKKFFTIDTNEIDMKKTNNNESNTFEKDEDD